MCFNVTVVYNAKIIVYMHIIILTSCVCITVPVYITSSPGGGTSFPVAQSVTLTCMASGSPASYSWSRTCTGCDDNDLTGTDQSVLTVANVRARDTGSYTCTVDGTMMSTATISRVEGKFEIYRCTHTIIQCSITVYTDHQG